MNNIYTSPQLGYINADSNQVENRYHMLISPPKDKKVYRSA